MRPIVRVLVAGLPVALACDAPTPPLLLGGITLHVVTAPGETTILDSGRILIRGVTSRDVSTTPGKQETIAGLQPGPYTVALEGFHLNAVYYFGQVTGVTVVAGQNTSAPAITFAPFTPGQPTFTDTFWIGKQVPVSFGSVGAPSYTVQWSEDPTFSTGVDSATVAGTTLQITVANYAVYWVRARATDSYQHAGALGAAARIRTVKFGPPKRLRFTGQPTTTLAGAAITPAVEVIAQDSLGDTAAAFSGIVTIAIAANPKNGTLSGTATVAASSGVARFSALSIDSAAIGYTLRATATGLTPDTSQLFTITPTAADLLIAASPTLTVSPTTVTQGNTVTVSGFKVTNKGNAASGTSIPIGYYLSADSSLTTSDVRLGGVSAPQLAPAETTAVASKNLTVPGGTTPGSYYLGALVDDSARTPESNESNNFQSTAVKVKVIFQVTAVLPPNGASGVEAGAVAAAQFSDAVNLATLNATSIAINTGGDTLPVKINYDSPSRTASLSAPLLPNSPYQGRVTTAVQDTAGRPLPSTQTWSFTTRAWQGIAVAAGGSPPSMRLYGGGAYVAHAGNGLSYSGCIANCTTLANWGTAVVDAAGQQPSLAIDSKGRLHITYFDGTLGGLKYATCAPSTADCTMPGNWQTAVLDTVGHIGSPVGYGSSIAIDQNDRLNVTYHGNSDFSTSDLKFATCDSVCTNPLRWQIITVDQAGDVGHYPSLAIDRLGRRHVSYYFYDFTSGTGDKGFLKYATCAAGCNTPANWDTVTVDNPGPLGAYSSLAVDSSGRPHVTYWGSGSYATFDNLVYATCTGVCSQPAGWQVVVVDHPSGLSSESSIGVDARGRLFVSYASGDDNISTLKFATCATACTSASSWRSSFVDVQAGKVGYLSSLVVDGQGRVHVSYSGVGGLWYVE